MMKDQTLVALHTSITLTSSVVLNISVMRNNVCVFGHQELYAFYKVQEVPRGLRESLRRILKESLGTFKGHL